jgi:hypothetical protein
MLTTSFPEGRMPAPMQTVTVANYHAALKECSADHAVIRHVLREVFGNDCVGELNDCHDSVGFVTDLSSNADSSEARNLAGPAGGELPIG